MESWVGLGGKEGRTNIRISAEPVSNWGPCGRKAEILPTAPTMSAQLKYKFLKKLLNLSVAKYFSLKIAKFT